MATTCVALIRGINLGRAKRVAMADLRAALGRLGFERVRTLLNSGNVVFATSLSPKTAAARIEQALEREIGVSAKALVITADELGVAVEGNRLKRVAKNPSRLFVAFLWETSDGLVPLLKQDWGQEALALGARTAYLWCPTGFDTPLVKAFHRAAGTGVTVRNWSTVVKLHALTKAEATSGERPKRAARAPTRR